MHTYPLRALSKDGRNFLEFQIQDGPCQLEENLFVLTNRKGTPILRYDTVLRGMDIPGLYEGDIIEHKGKEFVIQYQRGFSAVSLDKEIIQLEDIPDIKIISNIYKSDKFTIPRLTRYTYKYISDLVKLNNILGVYEGNLILNIKEGMLVPVDKLQQYAGITYQKKNLYFGDLVKGMPLVLHYGRCTVLHKNKFIDITRGELK